MPAHYLRQSISLYLSRKLRLRLIPNRRKRRFHNLDDTMSMKLYRCPYCGHSDDNQRYNGFRARRPVCHHCHRKIFYSDVLRSKNNLVFTPQSATKHLMTKRNQTSGEPPLKRRRMVSFNHRCSRCENRVGHLCVPNEMSINVGCLDLCDAQSLFIERGAI